MGLRCLKPLPIINAGATHALLLSILFREEILRWNSSCHCDRNQHQLASHQAVFCPLCQTSTMIHCVLLDDSFSIRFSLIIPVKTVCIFRSRYPDRCSNQKTEQPKGRGSTLIVDQLSVMVPEEKTATGKEHVNWFWQLVAVPLALIDDDINIRSDIAAERTGRAAVDLLRLLVLTPRNNQ